MNLLSLTYLDVSWTVADPDGARFYTEAAAGALLLARGSWAVPAPPVSHLAGRSRHVPFLMVAEVQKQSRSTPGLSNPGLGMAH